MMLPRDADIPLKRTPLHALHVASGAKMVPFAGYEMPVQYAAGILKEHLHTRAAAGLFDVSQWARATAREIRRGRERGPGAERLGLKTGLSRGDSATHFSPHPGQDQGRPHGPASRGLICSWWSMPAPRTPTRRFSARIYRTFSRSRRYALIAH